MPVVTKGQVTRELCEHVILEYLWAMPESIGEIVDRMHSERRQRQSRRRRARGANHKTVATFRRGAVRQPQALEPGPRNRALDEVTERVLRALAEETREAPPAPNSPSSIPTVHPGFNGGSQDTRRHKPADSAARLLPPFHVSKNLMLRESKVKVPARARELCRSPNYALSRGAVLKEKPIPAKLVKKLLQTFTSRELRSRCREGFFPEGLESRFGPHPPVCKLVVGQPDVD